MKLTIDFDCIMPDKNGAPFDAIRCEARHGGYVAAYMADRRTIKGKSRMALLDSLRPTLEKLLDTVELATRADVEDTK